MAYNAAANIAKKVAITRLFIFIVQDFFQLSLEEELQRILTKIKYQYQLVEL